MKKRTGLRMVEKLKKKSVKSKFDFKANKSFQGQTFIKNKNRIHKKSKINNEILEIDDSQ